MRAQHVEQRLPERDRLPEIGAADGSGPFQRGQAVALQPAGQPRWRRPVVGALLQVAAVDQGPYLLQITWGGTRASRSYRRSGALRHARHLQVGWALRAGAGQPLRIDVSDGTRRITIICV